MKKRILLVALLIWSFLGTAITLAKKINILIIGDSISIGYTPFVKKELANIANVHHNPGNGGSTKRGIDSINTWIGNGDWDIIIFNFGLHDLVHKDEQGKYDVNGKITTDLKEYKNNMKLIVAKLKKTNAELFFVTTTTVPENSPGRKVEDPAKYNAVAVQVMKKSNVKVIDLYTNSLTVHPQNSKPGNVHYSAKGYELLAEPIISAIKNKINTTQ